MVEPSKWEYMVADNPEVTTSWLNNLAMAGWDWVDMLDDNRGTHVIFKRPAQTASNTIRGEAVMAATLFGLPGTRPPAVTNPPAEPQTGLFNPEIDDPGVKWRPKPPDESRFERARKGELVDGLQGDEFGDPWADGGQPKPPDQQSVGHTVIEDAARGIPENPVQLGPPVEPRVCTRCHGRGCKKCTDPVH